MRVSSKNHETSSKSISQHNFDRCGLSFSRRRIHKGGAQTHTSVRRIHRWWCFDSTNDSPSRVAGEKPLAIGRVSLCVNRRFEFRETQSAFVRTHNGPLSAPAMCVSHEDRSAFAIHGCDAAPTPSGFAEVVGDGFPILHLLRVLKANHLQTPHVPPCFAQWLQ